MEYKGEGIEALVNVLDELQASSLILVDKKIRALLKCLAYYDEFRTVLAYCNRDFDYETEKRKAVQRTGDRVTLRLPKKPETLVALVSAMLLEFDRGAMELVAFAGDCFPAESKQASFDACYNAMMEPFKTALVGLVIHGVSEEPPFVERNVEFAAGGLHGQTEYLLVAFVRAVDESRTEQTEREELMIMLEGLSAALDSRDVLMIKAVWYGLRRRLERIEACAKEIAAMDEALRLYMVIK